jgi:hypothetical protein
MLHCLLLAAAPLSEWKPISPGVEYRTFTLEAKSELHVVRLDPEKAPLAFGLKSKGGSAHTAAQWARAEHFSVAINAGMFDKDQTSNVGRLVDGAHVNQAAFNHYQSVLVFGPKKAGLPRAQLVDLDEPGAKELIAQYGSAAQNLRLIKGPGMNQWKKNGRAWSESAIAQDKQGRLLFLFSRDGFEMAKWNDLVLALPLQVVKAMHVEGGPEASLSIHGGGIDLDLAGSYETGFNPNDENRAQWELPNVVGVTAAGAR